MRTERDLAPVGSPSTAGRVRRVLVAVDGTTAALHACEVLALMLEPGTEVRLLTVLSYDMYPYAPLGDPADDAPRVAAAESRVLGMQAGALRVLRQAGLSVEGRHRFGYAPDEIIDEVAEFAPDLLVLGRRGLIGPSRWLGSVSEHVLHRVSTPTLLVA